MMMFGRMSGGYVGVGFLVLCSLSLMFVWLV